MFTALVLSVLLPGVAALAESNGQFDGLVSCPPFWPGVDAPGLPLGNYPPFVWDGAFTLQIPDDDGRVKIGKNARLMLDCQYEGDRRLTVFVPDADVDCAYRIRPGIPDVSNLVCTAMADHTLPVTMQIAEHVTVQTTFDGFGLRQSLDAITALADQKSLKHEVIRDASKTPLRVIITGKRGEAIAVTLSQRTGLSREVLLSWPWDTGVDPESLYYAIALRFGFRRSSEWLHDHSWPSADKQAVLALVKRGWEEPHVGPYDARLTDLQSME